MKAKWNKPELVILYRGRPEEQLLCVCKSPQGGSGPDHQYNKCDRKYWYGGPCGACHPQPFKGS